MYTKPSASIKFEKGKSIYSIAGFSAYMNWMCSAVFNMLSDADAKTGKNGLKIDLTVPDKPKFKVVYV